VGEADTGNSPDTDADTVETDTGAEDTGISPDTDADTVETDTGAEDTGISPDTDTDAVEADTGAEDTGADDTGAEDTGADDTGGMDTWVSSDTATDASAPFTLTSPAFVDGGTLPAVYTCDGAGTLPPLAWADAPAGTAEFAVLMTTMARDGQKWNWVLFSIPAETSAIPEGDASVGVAGLTSDGPNLAYAPPCSQGPGEKRYTFTVYALSASPALPGSAREVTGPVLTEAIAPLTLATSAMTVGYTRPTP
jgi:phosphatidylethanolamine-binding protein (PEBP) family uncharacterized protein